MDLVASIRKEGSRGGRDSFKWSDVKNSTHRENYLGHSLMAPVGRWQQNRDLSWYAKGDQDPTDSPDEAAAKRRREREEEIKRVKEAEQEALARALGLPVAPKSSTNPNMTLLGGKETERAIQESVALEEGGEAGDRSRGVGFGVFRGMGRMKAGDQGDTMEGTGYAMVMPDKGLEPHRERRDKGIRGGRGEDRDRRRRDRDRDVDRGVDKERKSRRHDKDEDRRRRRRSISAERDHSHQRHSRSTGRRRDRSTSSDRASHRKYYPSSISRGRDRGQGGVGEESHLRRQRSRSPETRHGHHGRHYRRNDDYDRGR
ncbi:hypothetical protein AJ78_01962 [Emergomyces pasteurianus Ep9510]|uniref:Multiple myeloma tumor-associated protein 2-like N-terminal domain-containing protein n=1 Tax=Emergomyces pasteurianus Ep9510 TaxID=1447872 RepID=A0A1J9QRW0_9EURO|nr:hypothetical protein AJ78_01962 [Emergomyces pasteurianus Ep9510]